ncbi:hypothetical protein HRW18_11665 [Streptomyces lunaelactis]|uniref:hypothetical protein n=1 Tax=Streptomyces lunaelactis TaxID=1535768 RepID=UPI001585BCFF|nr:hypothetical protein [Streptomyces lunaelactis]NUK08655.1 hypothetical protein [Streptomyces lunaelactis]NUL10746.1 hypothetical protein [Streptomyces lunaelactis]NUL22572.1 hypothetical protein [Streptomyces lunaelactis]
MRDYIGRHQALNDLEFTELALGYDELPAGIDHDLFRGPLTFETPEEEAARLDAARDIIADLRSAGMGGDEVAAWDALYADALTRTVPFLRAADRAARGPASGTGEAA